MHGRTSTTNIGLGMLAIISAYDLKYIELEEMFFKGQYEMLYTLNRMDYFDKDIDNKS